MKKNARTPAVTLSRVEALRMAYGCQFHPGQRLNGSTAGVPDIAEQTDTRPARIISPFDPYILDRKRAVRLLDFEYTLECHEPEAKRRFGYFALPVLWHGKPLGLIDCKADRKATTLIIRRASLPDSPPAGFQEALDAELSALAAFNGCVSVYRGPAAACLPGCGVPV